LDIIFRRNLAQMSLSGTVPASIAALSHLVAMYSFALSLHDIFFLMFPLSIVLLFDSDLQDNELRSWPVEVFQLVNLTSLSGTSGYFAISLSRILTNVRS